MTTSKTDEKHTHRGCGHEDRCAAPLAHNCQRCSRNWHLAQAAEREKRRNEAWATERLDAFKNVYPGGAVRP